MLKLVVFWLAWSIAAALGFQYWKDAACDGAADCSYLIVVLDGPKLVLWTLGWLGLGLAISYGIWRSSNDLGK